MRVRPTGSRRGGFPTRPFEQAEDVTVSNRRRGSYDNAVLTVVYAEVLRLRSRPAVATRLVGDVRDRFPLHQAFLPELKAALQQTERGPR